MTVGCAVGPDYEAPKPAGGDEHAGFEALDTELMTEAAPEMAWWQELGVEKLNDLIREAAAHNHDLRIAQANVRSARAILTQGRLDRYPVVTASGEVTRQKTATQSGSTFEARSTLYQAGFDGIGPEAFKQASS